MANEIEKKEEDEALALSSAASKASNALIKDVEALNGMSGIEMTEGGKRCALNLLSELIFEFGVGGLSDLDRNDINKGLQFVSAYELDIAGGQAFIDKRKKSAYDAKEKKFVTRWTFKVQPQGNAYELMVAKFGVGVKRDKDGCNGVHRPWLVHDGDFFQDAQFDGIHVTAPVFKPSYKNMPKPVILVVYPIEKSDGSVDYVMADRAGVAKNLAAHILNNKLGDKPSAKDFDGGWKSPEFKKAQDDYNKAQAEMRKYLDGKTYEQMMADQTLDQYISPAWKSPSAKESMVITKMKKNALSGYTRDLGSRTRILQENDDDVDPAFKKGDVVDEQDGEKAREIEKPKQKIEPPSIAKPAEKQTLGGDTSIVATPMVVTGPEPKATENAPSANAGAQISPEGEITQPTPEDAQEATENEESGDSEDDGVPHFATEGL